MKEKDLLESNLLGSFPSFDEAKHRILCSELKQLYVSITRTRQRLWIWETVDEQSKPIFDYWKKKGLVEVRKLNESLVRSTQVSSSREEWRSQGIKVCYIYQLKTLLGSNYFLFPHKMSLSSVPAIS